MKPIPTLLFFVVFANFHRIPCVHQNAKSNFLFIYVLAINIFTFQSNYNCCFRKPWLVNIVILKSITRVPMDTIIGLPFYTICAT